MGVAGNNEGGERQEGRRVGQDGHQMPGYSRGPEVLTATDDCKNSAVHCSPLSPWRLAAPPKSPLRIGDLRTFLGLCWIPGWEGHAAPVSHCCCLVWLWFPAPGHTPPPTPEGSGAILRLLIGRHSPPSVTALFRPSPHVSRSLARQFRGSLFHALSTGRTQAPRPSVAQGTEKLALGHH